MSLKDKKLFYKNSHEFHNLNRGWAYIKHADNEDKPCNVNFIDEVFGIYSEQEFNSSSDAIDYLINNRYSDYSLSEEFEKSRGVVPPEKPFNHSSTSINNYWCKVVEMLQQNWAVIQSSDEGCTVFFFMDDSSIFDQMTFESFNDAKEALVRNGFSLFSKDEKLQEFITPPNPPFGRRKHPNGEIYSSGRFWK